MLQNNKKLSKNVENHRNIDKNDEKTSKHIENH